MPIDKERGQKIFTHFTSLIAEGGSEERYFREVHGYPLLICTSPHWSLRKPYPGDFDIDGCPNSLVVVVGKPGAAAQELYGIRSIAGDVCVPKKLLEYYQVVRSGVNFVKSRSHLDLQTILGFRTRVEVSGTVGLPFWFIPQFEVTDPEEQLIAAERLVDRIKETRSESTL